MPLETGDFIPELDPNNPLGSDAVSLGDDHMRLIKRAVTNSFPAFVGTAGVPKSVSLTEDQLSDAAFQNAANSFSATQTYNALTSFNSAPRLANNIPLTGRNAALTDVRDIAFIDTSDRLIIGDDARDVGAIYHASDHRFLGLDGDAFSSTTKAAGSLLVRDISDATQKVGFRNPFGRQGNLTQNFAQDDEGQIFWKPTNSAEVYTCNTLEAGTRITFVNTSGVAQQIVSGTAVVTGYPGGPVIASPLTIAQGTRVDLWWQTATIVQCWGGSGLT